MTGHLELAFELGALDPLVAEWACLACGAIAVTFVDAADDPVLEPAPDEVRLWPHTRVQCLFVPAASAAQLANTLAAALGLDPERIATRYLPERAWERKWLKDFHAMRFGRRLWVCPHHERVSEPGAVVVALDPGLAFGTGSHPTTALCLEWLDAHMPGPPAAAEHFEGRLAQGLDAHFPEPAAPAEHSEAKLAHGPDTHLLPGARVIDYGCGSGVLAVAAARLGATSVHCYDIDPQALTATRANAAANGVAHKVQLHERPETLPAEVDVLLANILAGPLCELAPRFSSLLGERGQVVLAGLMRSEAAGVTAAYAPCFDVVPYGERGGWVCLAGRRR